MKAFTKSLTILFMMMLAISCSKEDLVLPAEDELSDAFALKKAKVNDGTFELPLWSKFYCIDMKTGKPHMDGGLPSLGFLTIDGKEIILVVQELFGWDAGGNPIVYRETEFIGSIAPGGQLKFSYPETWKEYFDMTKVPPEYIGETPRGDVIGQVMDHTGCSLHGPGINKGTLNYKGSFIEGIFQASTHFTGKQIDEPSMDAYLGIEGPAHFKFSFEMREDD